MTYLAGEIVVARGKHRLIDPLNHLLVLIQSIGVAASYYSNGQVSIHHGDYIAIECNQFPLDVHLPLNGPVQAALKGQKPDQIQIKFEPTPVKSKDYTTESNGFREILPYAISPIFISFYENARPFLASKFGTNQAKWSPIWAFAHAIRNACAHGDHLLITHHRSVFWYHLTYDESQNGKRIVGGDLNLADMLVLLFELSDDLDRLENSF